LAIKKTTPTKTKFNVAIIDSLSFSNGLSNYVDEKRFMVNQEYLNENGWMLVNDNIQHLLQKIKSSGKALGEYVEGKIFRGILTGYNEAFVIDEATKNHLIEDDPKSVELIKPFLAGRDIKRYQLPKSNKWLIFTRRGIDIKQYPSVLNHLGQFRDRLTPKPLDFKGDNWQGRKEGNYKWYEIQDAIDYYEEFENIKIVWPETSLDNQFTFIDNGIYLNKTTFFIPSPDVALLGILNSNLMKFYLNSIVSKMRGGYFSLSKAYVETSPIPSSLMSSGIGEIVDQILSIKKSNLQSNTSDLENRIDHLVYQLYGLTDEEIRIIEN
jgi:hypothetical protein